MPAPGIGCRDLLTGHELYVAVAPEQADGLARGSVLVGAIVPLNGAWRTTGTFVRASPAEGDILREATQRAAQEFLDDLRRHSGLKRRPRPATASREAPPHNAYIDLDDASDPVFAGIAGKVLATGLPRLLAQVKAQLQAECRGDVSIDGDDQPGRWARGTTTADDGALAVEVNSKARLDRLVEVLTGMGARPTIVDQSRFGPSLDLAWPPGHPPMGADRALPPAGPVPISRGCASS